jgi:hypothetical protein
MKFRAIAMGLAMLMTLTGCGTRSVPIAPQNEIVLAKGDSVEVNHPSGTLKIEAGDGTTRYYYWDGIKIKVNLIPRTERWYGSIGIYNPASTFLWFGDQFPGHKGISRAVVEEGQRHFISEEDAHQWLTRVEGSAINHYVWTKDGLVVNFNFSPSRCQMNIDLWQFYINGTKPTNLAGAQDRLFSSSIAYKRISQPTH